MKNNQNKLSVKNIILPGILVAATGIGAGDLATASFSGSQLGLGILWAVVVGGIFKLILTEGLARWQLVTGTSFLEGVEEKFGKIFGWLFMPYMLLWSFFVGSALISACGVTLHAIAPIFKDPFTNKMIYGTFSSIAGLGIILFGGFSFFEKVMTACIGIMFVAVIITAIIIWPSTTEILSGIFIPAIPDIDENGVTWTIALIGGVGGTLTILSYGYWIREKGRNSINDIRISRIDLSTGYIVTVIFGLAMVIIGSTIKIDGSGVELLVQLSDKLKYSIGTAGSWLFLIGAFGAVFSSLLGVWQSVPYLFADIWRLFFNEEKDTPLEETKAYRYFLVGICIVPLFGLLVDFKQIQKLYAVTGSLFIPLLALALLILNGRSKWMKNYTNKLITIILLLATLFFFNYMAWMKWVG